MKGGNRWKGQSGWPVLVLHPLGTIPSLLYLTLTTHNPWSHLTLTTHNPWYDTESHQCAPFHTLALTQTRLPSHPASQTTSPHLQIQPRISTLRVPVCSPGQGPLPPPGCLRALLLGIWPEYYLILASSYIQKELEAEAIPLCSKKFNPDRTFQESKRRQEADMSAVNSWEEKNCCFWL